MVGPRIVASRIYAVLNPQIDHCEYEADLLGRSLTFRHFNRDFEHLKPLRWPLLPEGRVVYDDLRGEESDYDEAVDRHDHSLDELRSRAIDLYEALVEEGGDFSLTVERVVAEMRTEGCHGLPEGHREWLGNLAAHVVNDLRGDLPPEYLTAAVWNRAHVALKSSAPPEFVRRLDEARRAFAGVAEITRQQLVAIRRKWSRQYDIPVAPVPGVSIEASAD